MNLMVQAAHNNFQALQRVYAVLSDVERSVPLMVRCQLLGVNSMEACHNDTGYRVDFKWHPRSCRRKLYDETGSLEDSGQLSGEAFNNLYDYYRTMYPKVCAALPQLFQTQQPLPAAVAMIF